MQENSSVKWLLVLITSQSLSQFLGFIAQDKLGYDAVINSPQLSVALKKTK